MMAVNNDFVICAIHYIQTDNGNKHIYPLRTAAVLFAILKCTRCEILIYRTFRSGVINRAF
jgi:hypothetical protein